MLSDHTASLNLGFASKRKDGTLIKQNHVKSGYIHEELPDDSIYQGVDTFSEVLARSKSKEEHSFILQHHVEAKSLS